MQVTWLLWASVSSGPCRLQYGSCNPATSRRAWETEYYLKVLSLRGSQIHGKSKINWKLLPSIGLPFRPSESVFGGYQSVLFFILISLLFCLYHLPTFAPCSRLCPSSIFLALGLSKAGETLAPVSIFRGQWWWIIGKDGVFSESSMYGGVPCVTIIQSRTSFCSY